MTVPTPGVPNWVDLGTANLDDAERFYTGLFGWTAHVSGDDYGGYLVFSLDGRPAAGAGPLFGTGQPTAWSTYIATDDADAVAGRVEAAGGRVLVAPFDVMAQGRMAAFLDPAGAPFSVWQPGTMPGAEVFDVPGALTWNELTTRDVEGSKTFYGQVFGWTCRDSSMGGVPYVVWEHRGEPIAGMQPMIGEQWPDDLSPHWMIYFAVRDCDRSAALAHELGGRVVHPPTTLPMGRYAVLEDPQGGTFSILASDR
ncbi:VOC family protein [Mangrovihabitans endophyticus]|uniref:Glyoxalase n=1 Tax=Mangrovihabitans endophyticus TaxID=1751298 RepID=A0A8J3C1N4_9ACTN|nr:VOC family protein [Mangrovihabitans endophyticus]GGK97128.1 glyoxalase [Mangrovihabitans endophyticus]